MKLHIPPRLYRLLVAVLAFVPAPLYGAGMQVPTSITIPEDYTTVVSVDSPEDVLAYSNTSGKIAFTIDSVGGGLVFEGVNQTLQIATKSSWYITSSSAAQLSTLSFTNSTARPFYVEGGQEFLMENLANFNFSGGSRTAYGDNRGGTCMIVYGTAGFHNNGNLTFTDNLRSYQTSGTGGVFYVCDGDSLSFTQNNSVSFSGNTASANKQIGAGGAIYAMRGAQLNFADNKTLSFVGNKALAITLSGNPSVTTYRFAGGALYLEGTEKTGNYSTNTSRLTISGNSLVEFRGNEACSEVTDQHAYACYGGALYSGNESVVTISGNGSVVFESNVARPQAVADVYKPDASSAFGGAVHVGDSAQFSVSGNSSVLFNQNTACSISEDYTGYARGGAIHGGAGAILSFADNDSLKFTGNVAYASGGASNSYAYVSGGAIFVTEGGAIELVDNKVLELSGNKVQTSGMSSWAHGGAISGMNISICGNDSVAITGNVAQATKDVAQGGAIYGASTPTSGPFVGGVVTIAGNGNVLIENNAEIDKNGTRMRAIYTIGQLELSASTGKEIRVRDTIYASGAVTLNADYTPTNGGSTAKSGGMVVLDGSATAGMLKSLLGRDADSEELRASHTSHFGATTMHNGTFAVQNEACLMADSFTMDSAEATLSLNSGKMRTESLSTNGKPATLSLSGSTYALFTQADLGENTTLSFESAGVAQSVRLAGDIATGALTIDVDAATLTKGNSYCLFTLAAGSSMEWDPAQVTLTGSAAADGKLVWNNGSLYFDYGVTGEGTVESMIVEDGRILSQEHLDVTQATAALLYTAEGSQKYMLKEDITLNGKSLTFNGLVGYYEVTSEDLMNKASLTVSNVEGGMLGGLEANYRLNLHNLSALTFDHVIGTENAGAIYLADGSAGDIHDIGAVTFIGRPEGDLLESLIKVTGGSTLTFENNGSVTVQDNLCSYGGGIMVSSGSKLEMVDNGEVNFTGNGRPIINNNSYIEYGGAIYSSGTDSRLSIHDNALVTFNGNSAERGGAIYVSDGAYATIADNEQVIFTANGKEAETPAAGGAVYVNGVSTMEMTGNKSLIFRENAVGSTGGAIRAKGAFEKGGAVVLLSGNDTILMEGNMAYSGSAISLDLGANVSIVGNGDVLIQNNLTQERAGNLRGSAIEVSHDNDRRNPGNNLVLSDNRNLFITGNYGCGIDMHNYGGSLKLQNNDYLLVGGNYYVDDNGNYITRGMTLGGATSSATNTEVIISAAAGHVAEIRDYITVKGNIDFALNADYVDADNKVHKQTGDILFTGAHTANTIKDLKGGIDATETELAASRKSTVEVMTTLYGGRLRIEDGVVFQGQGLTVAEGSDATVLVKDATLDHTGYDLTFHSGTTLEIQGDSAVYGNLVMKSGAALVADAAYVGLSGVTSLGDSLSVSSRTEGAAMSKLSLTTDGVSGKTADSGLTSVTLTTGNKTYFLSDVSLTNVELTSTNATAYSLTNVAVDSASTFSLNGGSVTMHGAGKYDIGTATALAAGVSLADDWSGIIKLTGSNLAGFNIDTLIKGNSAVELSGVSGYLSQANNTARTYAANLILTNNGESAAWSINDGWSGDNRTFAGTISGTGDIVRSSWRGTVQNITFAGDTSGWTGAFHHNVDSGFNNGNVVKTNLTFNGSSEINAEIKTNGKGELNVTLDDANIKTPNTAVKVTRDMVVTSLTVTEGTAAILMQSLTSHGESRLQNGASLCMGNAITFKGVNGAEGILKNIILTATEAAGGELTNLTIQSGSSTYGISDALLNNVRFDSSADSVLTLANVNIGQDCSFNVGADGLIVLSGATLNITLPNLLAGESGVLSIDCSNLFHCTAEGDLQIALGMTVDELVEAGYNSIQVDFGSDVDYTRLDLGIEGAGYMGAVDGKATFTLVPEPSTATLSLLALAGLAARRRRK